MIQEEVAREICTKHKRFSGKLLKSSNFLLSVFGPSQIICWFHVAKTQIVFLRVFSSRMHQLVVWISAVLTKVGVC